MSFEGNFFVFFHQFRDIPRIFLQTPSSPTVGGVSIDRAQEKEKNLEENFGLKVSANMVVLAETFSNCVSLFAFWVLLLSKVFPQEHLQPGEKTKSIS